MTKLNKILVALLIAQLGIILLTKAITQKGEVRTERKMFPELTADQITAMSVTDKEGKSLRLEKKGKEWVLASGGDYPAEKEKVGELLGKFPGLVSREVVATKKAHHRALEVADDKFLRHITLEAGDKTYDFFLGSSPGLKAVHFRTSEDDDVYVVKGLSAWDVGTSATSWVSNEYFKVDKEQIVSATLENEAGTISLTKDEGGKWQLAGLTEDQEQDDTAIGGLINSAASVYLQEPIGKGVRPEHGLRPAKAKLTLVVEIPAEKKAEEAGKAKEAEKVATAAETPAEEMAAEPTRVTYLLEVGVKAADRKSTHYYAKGSTSDYVVTIGSWNAEQLTQKKLADLIKKPEEEEKPAG